MCYNDPRAIVACTEEKELVLVVQLQGVGDALTASAAAAYFFARLAHFVIYSAGIPVLRTLCFFIGFAAQMVLALRLLGTL